MLFQSTYRDYTVMVDMPFSAEEGLAYRQFQRPGFDGKNQDPNGFMIKFNAARLYNTDGDHRFDNDPELKQHVESVLLKSHLFGKEWWIYDEGQERMEMSKNDLEKLIAQRVKETINEKQKQTHAPTQDSGKKPAFAGG